MKEIEVTLKFLTPTFIGGYEPLNIVEFRTQSLKGLLRFWWRVFCTDNIDLDEMIKKENEIFGGQENKSSFNIKVIDDCNLENLSINELNQVIEQNYTNIKYLFYSILPMGSKENREKYIKENGEIKLSFIFNEKKKDNIVSMINSLWALENFGGIGARSRRGGGSFKITEIKGLDNIDSDLRGTLPQFLYQYEKENLDTDNSLNNFINNNIQKFNKYNGLPKFTRYSNNYFDYKIIYKDERNNNFNDWKTCLNYIGEKYKIYRSNFKSQEENLFKKFIYNNYFSNNIQIKRSAFGLPIIYKFSTIDLKKLPDDYKNEIISILNEISLDPKEEFEKFSTLKNLFNWIDNNGNIKEKKRKEIKKEINKLFNFKAQPYYINKNLHPNREDYQRRASPLFIKIGEFKNNYYILISMIWSKFLPDDYLIKIENPLRKRDKIPQPDESVIKKIFINL